MQSKAITIILGLLGVYFLIFHSDPFPFNHDAIGLPPVHDVHRIFGVILLGAAIYLGWKSMKTKTQT